MVTTFGVKIDLMRFLRGSVIAKPFCFMFDRYACAPLVLKPNHTHKAGLVSFVGAAHIFSVTRFVYQSKIAQAIVRFITINVVNQPVGPYTMHNQPCKSMRFVNASIDAHGNIPLVVNTSGNIASFNCPTWPNFPNQHASFSAVFKYFSQLFCGNIGFAHLSPLVLSLNVNTGITK